MTVLSAVGMCKLTKDCVSFSQYHSFSFHFSDTEDNNLKLLMRKWSYFLPPADYSSSTDLNTMTAGGRMKLNTLRIQEGVLEMYLAGKPMIESAKTLYTSFSFVPQPGTSNE